MAEKILLTNDDEVISSNMLIAHEALDKIAFVLNSNDMTKERIAFAGRQIELAQETINTVMFDLMPFIASTEGAGEVVVEIQNVFADMKKIIANENQDSDKIASLSKLVKETHKFLGLIDG